MPDVGDLIGERYRLADRIAAGGMGEVWRAVDETLNRTVAVKTLRTRFIEEASAGERFRREARAMAALRHPGVAEVYDYGEAPLPGASGLAYIVMAYVQGQPLSERIAERGRLGTAETLSIVVQTAHALQAAHDVGVVHRDVKPGNLIIEPDGHVVLVDFGIALSPEATSLTAANQVVGTVLYMAPEQLSEKATPAADIYALGAVAYHCLAGHPPFPGENPVAVALRRLDEEPPPLPDDVPTAVRDLVATAMAKDPDRRYPTAAAMAATAEAVAGPPASPTAPTLVAVAPAAPARAEVRSPESARRPSRRMGAWRGITGVVLALLATAAAAVVFADRTGWSPGPSDGPSSSAVPSPQDPGRGDPANAPSGARSARPDPNVTSPAARSSEPASGTTSAGSGATPSATVRPSAEPTAPTTAPTTEPTAEPTPEPTGDADSRSPSSPPTAAATP
ncbi:protein kinase [Micromonospora sp. NPDC049799]|uniref:serine/threonine-protein kinase n=1 Tax=Micromonospora sp. NPDC049799 TaxID=3154741 RepID=UPI0034077207